MNIFVRQITQYLLHVQRWL